MIGLWFSGPDPDTRVVEVRAVEGPSVLARDGEGFVLMPRPPVGGWIGWRGVIRRDGDRWVWWDDEPAGWPGGGA